MSIKSLKQIAVACVCSLGAALCISTITIGQQKSDTKLPAQARPLTPSERRGRIIYLRGETASKREMTAVTALESLSNYDTGLTPKLIFGPHRRVGAAGAYVLTIDAETKQFVPLSGWVTAN